MMKGNFRKHKLRTSITAIVALCLVFALSVVAVYKFPTLASLFQRDKDGMITEKNTIKVLEIVAQNGQQTIGYTVAGQEPISVEKIESYHGDIDANDFKNATGYVVEKRKSGSSYSYKVVENVLSDTFNLNVLGGNMTDEGDSIIVRTVQANNLTSEDLVDADLVYLNSADTNNNLLYYYDQIMNDGKGNIEPGTYGATYNDAFSGIKEKKTYALEIILAAVGKPAKADMLTAEIYKWAGVKSFDELYLSEFNKAIAELTVGTYGKSSEEDIVKSLNKLYANVQSDAQAVALDNIKSFSQRGNITDEERAILAKYLQQGRFKGSYEINIDSYINTILTQKINSVRNLNSVFALCNNDNLNAAVAVLKECKDAEEKDVNRVAEVIGCVMSDDYVSANRMAYAQYFLSDDFEIDSTTAEKRYAVLVGETFKAINEAEKENALITIAQAPASDEAMQALTSDAERMFEISELENYDKDLLDVYLSEMSTLKNKKAFLTQKENVKEETTEEETTEEETTEEETTEEETTEEETTEQPSYVWTYDIDAIETFLQSVNDKNKDIEVPNSYDMTWESAMALYEYAMVQERGFMYNTNLLEKHTIGDYTTSDIEVLNNEGVDNTNNVYKMLLVLRQMTPSYFTSSVLPKIDSEGYYFTQGLDENGVGITSETDKGNNAWYKGTFMGTNSADASKFREPDVVGDTFAVDAKGKTVKGPAKNYVYKRTYSFSGGQFLGGDSFVNGFEATEGEVTTGVEPYIQDSYAMHDGSLPILLEKSNLNWSTYMAHIWKDNSNSYNVALKKANDYDSIYYGYETKGYKNFLFAKDTNYKQKTVDITNVNLKTTNKFKISGQIDNNGANTISSKAYIAEFGFFAVPGANDENYAINFVEKLNVTLNVKGNTNTKYSVVANGKTIMSGSYKDGTVITLGDGIAENQEVTLKLTADFSTYKEYHYKKVAKTRVGLNYESYYTASNSTMLAEDNTQTNEYKTLTKGGCTKGDIIEYIMGVQETIVSKPYKVLVIEPVGGVEELNNYDSAVYLAKSLKFDYSQMTEKNYSEYFKVTCMGVREFNTRKEDLTAKYDLIYIGTNSGTMSKYKYISTDKTKSIYRTYFKDKSMDGLVYTGIGDIITIRAGFRGTAAEDYTEVTGGNTTFKSEMDNWKKFFFAEFENNSNPSWNLNRSKNYVMKTTSSTSRLSGNDITVDRMNDLLTYLKAGYPVMFADGLLNSDEYVSMDEGLDNGSDFKNIGYDKAVKLRYVDKYSKMYNFIEQAKKLGYDEMLRQYTGKNSDGTNTFLDGRRCASLIKYEYAKSGKNPDYLDNEHKFDGGLAYAAKRNLQVDFELIEGPQQYHMEKGSDTKEVAAGKFGNDIDDTKGYSIVLSTKTDVSKAYVEDNFDVNVYIDKSGIGSFMDKVTLELEPTVKVNDDRTVSIKGKWPGDLEGFIPWKVEVTGKANPENKWTYIGYSSFPCKEPKPVNVLWVKTEGNHLEFKDKLDKAAKDIKDYTIKTYTVSYKDFVAKWKDESVDKVYNENNSLLKVGTFEPYSTDAGSSFDMIVFGYCDSYSGLDINNIACLNNIDYYVNVAKHSLLFAHDNAGWRTSYNYYTDSNAGKNADESCAFARYTTSYMRAMLGMDYYGASFSPLAFNIDSKTTDKPVLKDLYIYNQGIVNSRMYLKSSMTQSDYRGYQDGHLLRYRPEGTGEFWPYKKDNGTGAAIGYTNKNLATTTAVKRVNQGQITMYPYNIGENLKVSTTHFQYTKLNMEDSDVTVWYTLNSTSKTDFYNVTAGDGSNNFYIYSKGNITYTGAGHSQVNEDVEIKLFINTVVAAIKVGNMKPTIEYTNAHGSNSIIYAYDTDDSFEVKFKPTDYDNKKGEKCFSEAIIYIDVNGDGKFDTNDRVINGTGSILKDYENSKDADDKGELIYKEFNGSDLENRTEHRYEITYEDICRIGLELHKIWYVNWADKNDVYNKAMEFLSQCNISMIVKTNNINQYGENEEKVSDPCTFMVRKKKLNFLN